MHEHPSFTSGQLPEPVSGPTGASSPEDEPSPEIVAELREIDRVADPWFQNIVVPWEDE
jgi:hypothetical protein